MNSILDEIKNEDIWYEYIDFKEKQLSVSKQEIDKIKEYVVSQKYLEIAENICNGKYVFSIPTKKLINKINKTKKRAVYSYNEDENYILKVITYLFSKRYDEKYSDNCYSFRREKTVKEGIRRLTSTKKLNYLYGYKTDISDYFNSINVNLLLKKLEIFLSNDKKLFEFIEKLLLDDRVVFNGKIIHERKGIMAGVPISSFLANIFLNDVDEYFKQQDILYIRYSDDIILFTEKEKIDYYIDKLNYFIKINELAINEDKKVYIKPNDKWDFLGFCFENEKIDISDISKKKIKGKIKRLSKKLRRWMLKKDATVDRAIRAMNKKINKKFYGTNNNAELTWNLWYFPVINTTKGLHEIDLYIQQNLRYIATGKYSKKNYNIRYDSLRELGYQPLVAEYYKFKKYQSRRER